MDKQQQAQIDAIEHLLLAVLREHSDKDATRVFARAETLIMDNGGLCEPDQKARAAQYLNRLRSLF